MLLRALFGLVLALAASGAAAESRVPQPAIERAAKGEQCIAPADEMRRRHPEMLKHQRDETVRGGVRGAEASLKGCIDCHASRDTGSVAAKSTDFCVSCHAYAAVRIDCFECHATKPKQATAFHPLAPHHGSAGGLKLAAQWRALMGGGAK